MVEIFIGTHAFTITIGMWDHLQSYMREFMDTGSTQFGFIDIHNTYREVRLSNGITLITVTGPAPEYVRAQFPKAALI